MIHVATVHWMSDRWVDVQLRELARYIAAPYRVWASVEGIAADVHDRFDVAFTEPTGPHAEKLNFLAEQIALKADADDVLMFIDGDAFPVAPLVDPIRAMLARYPLVAVRRAENLGDAQPHPCFCATTVGFWHEIRGDWRPGYQWQKSHGKWVTDVGGNLLGILQGRGVEWYPLLRSNRRSLHPVYFSVYADLVYHHGAGFRKPFTSWDKTRIERERARAERRRRVIRRLTGWERTSFLPTLRERRLRVIDENRRLSNWVYERINDDPDFVRWFLGEGENGGWQSRGNPA